MPEAPLTAIAEIAITIAGFTGVIFALGQDVRDEEKTRLTLILLMALQAVVCALLPYGISDYTDSASSVWGIPLVLNGSVSLFFSATAIVYFRTGKLSSQLPGARLMLVLGTLVSIAAILAGFSIGFEPTFGLLTFVLIWQIISLVSTFLFTLRYLWRDRTEIDGS